MEENIPQAIKELAQTAINESLPSKSKDLYKKAFSDLTVWMKKNGTKSCCETIFLAYFQELSTKVAPTTLWSKFSMIKSILNNEKNIDIKNYSILITFIKTKNVGYAPDQAHTFSSEDVTEFLTEASDNEHLDKKVVLMLEMTGACRREELHSLMINDVVDKETHLVVTLRDTQNKSTRVFTMNEPFRSIVKKYSDMRQEKSKIHNFFLSYQKGKSINQTIGVNKIGKIPAAIAEYLNLPNHERYTGHTLRRTSATLLAESGASIEEIKRQGGWRTSFIADHYVEDYVASKKKRCDKITEAIFNEESNDTITSNAMKHIKVSDPDSNAGSTINISFNFKLGDGKVSVNKEYLK